MKLGKQILNGMPEYRDDRLAHGQNMPQETESRAGDGVIMWLVKSNTVK